MARSGPNRSDNELAEAVASSQPLLQSRVAELWVERDGDDICLILARAGDRTRYYEVRLDERRADYLLACLRLITSFVGDRQTIPRLDFRIRDLRTGVVEISWRTRRNTFELRLVSSGGDCATFTLNRRGLSSLYLLVGTVASAIAPDEEQEQLDAALADLLGASG